MKVVIMEECCEVRCIHAESVALAQAQKTEDILLERVATMFGILADQSRLRIVDALRVAELCVCDLGAVLGMSVSAISHQLRLLRAARIVRSRRDGKVVYYSLDDQHVLDLLSLATAHCKEPR